MKMESYNDNDMIEEIYLTIQNVNAVFLDFNHETQLIELIIQETLKNINNCKKIIYFAESIVELKLLYFKYSKLYKNFENNITYIDGDCRDLSTISLYSKKIIFASIDSTFVHFTTKLKAMKATPIFSLIILDHLSKKKRRKFQELYRVIKQLNYTTPDLLEFSSNDSILAGLSDDIVITYIDKTTNLESYEEKQETSLCSFTLRNNFY